MPRREAHVLRERDVDELARVRPRRDEPARLARRALRGPVPARLDERDPRRARGVRGVRREVVRGRAADDAAADDDDVALGALRVRVLVRVCVLVCV